MKISLEWLNEYLDRPVDPEEAERLLTEQGFPVEEVDDGSGSIIDIEVTSNRSDCLSHVGVAREIAAGSNRRLVLPDAQLGAVAPEAAGNVANDDAARVDNEATDLCPLYTARVIRSVQVGPSPSWLTRRLETVGLRSVNNVVDITNYVLFETGQPLHAFDMARLAQRRIVVRLARPGESFVAIDGSKHELDERALVIADDARPVAVAGVMGGQESEVGAQTVEILLESAIFDPLSVRRTSRRLKLASDSSFRFERGVDPLGVDAASRRAVALIRELAEGQMAGGVICAGSEPAAPSVVSMRVERCRALIGIDLDCETMVNLLERLGLKPRPQGDGQRIACTVPSYRLDLSREIDLIEEVARMHGLEQIAVNERIYIVARSVSSKVAARQCLGNVLTAHGFHETVTSTFLAPRHGDPFVPAGDTAVWVDESRRVGARVPQMLRPSLLPSLLVCRKFNKDVGNADLHLFEAAATWTRRDGHIAERQKLAMLSDAASSDDGVSGRQTSMRRMRGTVEELASNLGGRGTMNFVPAKATRLEAAARIELNGREIGVAGFVDASLQNLFDLQAPVAVIEIDLAALLDPFPPSPQVVRLPRYPAVERDLSIVVDEKASWDDIQRLVWQVDSALLEDVCYLTIYRGSPVPAGRKSVSFRMVFRAADATLRHEQVDAHVGEVVERLKKQLGAKLRKEG